MFEDETELQKTTDKIVANILAANIAAKKIYTDERVGEKYWNLITPDAFDKKLIVIAVLGYPECAGVWSYTLLRQSRISESSMESYFHEFRRSDLGLVAINPNFFGPDIEGDSFIYQLERVIADIDTNKKIGFIGFSMGGKILVEFLEQRPELLERVVGLALIDPTLPNRLKIENIRRLLDNDTLLVASEGEVNSPGEISSMLLQIPKISFPGIHGEMPNKSLREVIKFYKKRTL
ncbi:MAG: alpha/beta fold hydrolase [Planctomycetota bacterium]|jgi:pimeloyl-ACP methyl ester carboxylesterase